MIRPYETQTVLDNSEQDQRRNNKMTTHMKSQHTLSSVIGDGQLVMKQTHMKQTHVKRLNVTSGVEDPVSGEFGEHEEAGKRLGKPEKLPAILVEKKEEMMSTDASDVHSATTPVPCEVTARNTESLLPTIVPRVRVSPLNKYPDNQGLKTGMCIKDTRSKFTTT